MEFNGAIHWVVAIVGFLVSVLTATALWKSTNMTARIANFWHLTFGKAHYGLNCRIDEMMDILQRVVHQVEPNNQTSMSDAIARIEEAQQDYFALMGARLDADHQAIVTTDANGKVNKISRAFQDISGMSLDMMQGDGWIRLIHPDEKQESIERWNHIVAGRREDSFNQRYVRPDNGKILNVHVKVYRQRDRNNRIRGYLAVIHLLDDHKLCPYSNDASLCAAAFHKEIDCS